MIKYDYQIAVTIWLVALLTMPLTGLLSVATIAATTINLWHQRRTLYQAGMEFDRRVHQVLTDRLHDYETRMKRVESGVEDVRATQVQLNGQFRQVGRNA